MKMKNSVFGVMPVVRFCLRVFVFLGRLAYMPFTMFDVLQDAWWLPDLSTLNIVSDSDGLGSENLKRGLITPCSFTCYNHWALGPATAGHVKNIMMLYQSCS